MNLQAVFFDLPVAFGYMGDVTVYWSYRQRDDFRSTGTLNGLVAGYVSDKCPIGIVIDQLEECPDELLGATPEQVRAIVAHLRLQHPNGV